MRDFFWDAVGHPGDRNAPEAMPDKNDVCELFALDDLDKVVYKGANCDIFAQEMRSVPHASVTWRVDNMALATELIGHAPPAPSTMPRAVCQDERFRCSLCHHPAWPGRKSARRDRLIETTKVDECKAHSRSEERRVG